MWSDPLRPLAFTYCTLCREVSVSSSYLRSREWGSTSLRVEYLHKLLRIFLYEEICFFLVILNLFSYLYWYALMDFFFYTLDYNPVLLYSSYFSNCSHFGYWEFFQFVPVSFWNSFIMMGFFFFFMMGFLKHALTFWHHQVLQTHVCLAPVLDSSIFPRSPGLLLENGVGIQDWSLGVLMITRMSWLLGLLSWQSREMYRPIITCYTPIWEYSYVTMCI